MAGPDDETRRLHRSRALGLSTPIQVGALIGVAGFLVGSIWWAATMQAKLDQLLDEVKGVRALESKMVDIEARVKALERKP